MQGKENLSASEANAGDLSDFARNWNESAGSARKVRETKEYMKVTEGLNTPRFIRFFLFWILVASVAAPAADAQFPATQYTFAPERYFIANNQSVAMDVALNGTAVFNHSFTNVPLHDAPIGLYGLRFEVTMTAFFVAEMNGDWRLEVRVDDEPVSDCYMNIRTLDPGGFLAGDLPIYVHYALSCLYTPPEGPHEATSHNLTVVAIIQSGTPDALGEVNTDILVEREDIYLIAQDSNEILDTFVILAPLLAFVVFGAWAEKMRNYLYYIPAVASGVYAVAALAADYPSFVLYLVMALLLVIARAGFFWSETQYDEED